MLSFLQAALCHHAGSIDNSDSAKKCHLDIQEMAGCELSHRDYLRPGMVRGQYLEE